MAHRDDLTIEELEVLMNLEPTQPPQIIEHAELERKIKAAIKAGNIGLFRKTFHEIFSSDLFRVIRETMGRVGFMVNGLSCLHIFPITVAIAPTPAIAPAPAHTAHIVSPDTARFVWELVSAPQTSQTYTLKFHRALGTSVSPLTTLLGTEYSRFAELRKMTPADFKDRTLTRVIGRNIPIDDLQLFLYRSFFEGILTVYRTGDKLHKDRLFDPSSHLNTHPTFVQDMFIKLQQIIYDFCVTAVGSKLQPIAIYPSTYTEYMTHSDHYLHCFKMLFLIAEELLSLPPDGRTRKQIEDMIYFLSRSIFIMLSVNGVNEVVKFIFRLCEIADTINRVSSPELKRQTIVLHLTDFITSIMTGTFSHFFRNSEELRHIWLQKLLLQNQVVIVSQDEWIRIWKEATGKSRRRTSPSKDESRSKRQTPSNHGGSNKKKGHPKRSKKSKKSGRNKKVRANKKSKSRRNKKM